MTVQTTYDLDLATALAGQIVSEECVLGRYEAGEAIAPGLMTELHTDGKLRVYRGGKKAGIAVYKATKQDASYAIGEMVTVIREGTVWAACVGSAGADFTDVNFSFKDTTTADRGKATSASPSAASDAQVYDGGPCKFIGSATGLALLDCDFGAENLSPGASSTVLSQAANDYAVPADNGAVYEINTTAANSTVSLPAASPDGTVCYIAADGTKNGHTLTFRDVTTAISAATTASKRVAAVAMKVGGKWAVTLTVGP